MVGTVLLNGDENLPPRYHSIIRSENLLPCSTTALSTKHESRARKRSAFSVEPEVTRATSGGLTALLESATEEILAPTYWLDPHPDSAPYPVTVRFSGRRLDVKGRPQARDRFTHDETIEEVIPGSGPVTLTARIGDINPGEWEVTAHVLEPRTRGRRREPGSALPPDPSRSALVRVWRRWAPPPEMVGPVRTCPGPFARVPGVLPGVWGVLVAFGMVIALAIQALVIARDHLAIGSAWEVSLLAIAVGIAGAKIWYAILHRRAHRLDGWCIQGFVAGASLSAALMLPLLGVPAGSFLDATAPGLMIGIGVGRVGCFLAGCCGGPLTASRWGVWSSDQRVGGRRVPTQLLEFLFALILGLVVLVAVLQHGPAHGAFFVAALATYTLGRQGLLRLRLEPRQTTLGGPAVAVLAALVLAASLVVIAR